MSEFYQSRYSGRNALVKQEYELQRASLHAWSRTEGGQLRAAVGIVYESDGEDQEQELITVIQQETKRTEEKEKSWV